MNELGKLRMSTRILISKLSSIFVNSSMDLVEWPIVKIRKVGVLSRGVQLHYFYVVGIAFL